MAAGTQIYATLTGADEQDVAPREAANGAIHAVSLTLTKCADGLIDPKLILAWLLNAVGAPGAVIGALVPVREAGSLLPQIALAPRISSAPQRRRIWAAASALQGLAALAIALAVTLFEGALAGWLALIALGALAVARAGASLSYKDALARSIPKTRRGAVSGFPASIAAAFVLAYGAALALGLIPLTATALSLGIAVAGAFWLIAALMFLRLDEDSAEDDAAEDTGWSASALLAPLRDDPQLRIFITARALLTVTALAPPFIIMLSASEKSSGLGELGLLIIASAAASIISGYIWGRFSDHSSRQTMAVSGVMAGLVFAAIASLPVFGAALDTALAAAVAIFAAQIAYEGVRAARKLHLTDMVGDDLRARYTALSNTLIGGVLLFGGGFGLLAELIGAAGVIGLFAVLSLAGAAVALRLDEVQREEG